MCKGASKCFGLCFRSPCFSSFNACTCCIVCHILFKETVPNTANLQFGEPSAWFHSSYNGNWVSKAGWPDLNHLSVKPEQYKVVARDCTSCFFPVTTPIKINYITALLNFVSWPVVITISFNFSLAFQCLVVNSTPTLSISWCSRSKRHSIMIGHKSTDMVFCNICCIMYDCIYSSTNHYLITDYDEFRSSSMCSIVQKAGSKKLSSCLRYLKMKAAGMQTLWY